MKCEPVHINLTLAWIWVLMGFASGSLMGLRFHQEQWLGGYGSFKRRLYRLAHISFFGLGAANLMFYFTASEIEQSSRTTDFASWSFVVGAVTMPVCCVLTAHYPKVRHLFAVPVFFLIIGAILTIMEVVKL